MAAPRAGPSWTTRIIAGLVVGIGLIVAETVGADRGVLRSLELLTLDWRFEARGPIAPSRDVALVMVDDRTIARFGGWPLPRDLLASAVDRLSLAGARVIAFNLLLADSPDTLSAEAQAALKEAGALAPEGSTALRQRIDRLLADADSDHRLARALARADRVVLPYAFVADPRSANVAGMPSWVRSAAYPVVTVPPGATIPTPRQAQGLVVPASSLAAAAKGVGHVTLVVDVDGALRFDLPAFAYGDELYPSLAVEAVRTYLGLPRSALAVRVGEGIDIGRLVLETDSSLRQIIDYYGPAGTIPSYSLVDLIDGKIPSDRLAGRIVLIGASATGVGDAFVTPFAQRLSGTEDLATAIDNILTGRELIRDRWTKAVSLAATLVLALAATALAGRRTWSWSAAMLLALLALWTGAAFLAFSEWRLWLALPMPLAAAAIGVGTVEAMRLRAEQRQRRTLERERANLGRYFPPTVVDRLAGGQGALERTQDAAVMFVDIIGFTKRSHHLSPADAMALLRAFHTRVERAVFAHGGMVDKFIGDGALACFGVPDTRPDDCSAALRAARALDADLAAWGEATLAQGQQPLQAGIGIHHGSILTGDIGGDQQFQFTVIGDTVNVASRIEGLTRTENAAIIISDAVAVRAAAEDPDALQGMERLSPRPLRGVEEPIGLWRLPRPSQ